MSFTENAQPVYKQELGKLIKEYLSENLEISIQTYQGSAFLGTGNTIEIALSLNGDVICVKEVEYD